MSDNKKTKNQSSNFLKKLKKQMGALKQKRMSNLRDTEEKNADLEKNVLRIYDKKEITNQSRLEELENQLKRMEQLATSSKKIIENSQTYNNQSSNTSFVPRIPINLINEQLKFIEFEKKINQLINERDEKITQLLLNENQMSSDLEWLYEKELVQQETQHQLILQQLYQDLDFDNADSDDDDDDIDNNLRTNGTNKIQNEKKHIECIICFLQMQSNQILITCSNCRNYFHRACILQWKMKSCPLCLQMPFKEF